MLTVYVYIAENHPDCNAVIEHLRSLENEIEHRIVVLNIEKERLLTERFGSSIPVVQIGPYQLSGKITLQDLRIALMAAHDRQTQKENLEPEIKSKKWNFSFLDDLTVWMTRHLFALLNAILFLFLFGAFLPPFLYKAGLPGPANVIYAIYRPFCHQLAYRSYFLFGEQPIYPRALAGIEGYRTYEEAISQDLDNAYNFIGNEALGYKIALCQRDIPIFSSMLLYGILFVASGKRFRRIHPIFIVIILIPILLDGLSQIPGVVGGDIPDWMPIRESTPLLRAITGFIFGFGFAAYLFPFIEESLQYTRIALDKKAAQASLIKDNNEFSSK